MLLFQMEYRSRFIKDLYQVKWKNNLDFSGDTHCTSCIKISKHIFLSKCSPLWFCEMQKWNIVHSIYERHDALKYSAWADSLHLVHQADKSLKWRTLLLTLIFHECFIWFTHSVAFWLWSGRCWVAYPILKNNPCRFECKMFAFWIWWRKCVTACDICYPHWIP